MRIIHFADLHIGVDTYGRLVPDRGWSTRMQDFLDAFDHLVAFALAEGVDAVIFAGDAYKAREPSQTHQREFARRIRQLSSAGIPTFLLVGNHDLPNAEGRAHALEIYRTLDVPDVTVGDNAWFGVHGMRPRVLQTRSGPLQVAYLPWPQVSRFLANNPQHATLTIDQVEKLVEEEMTEAMAKQADLIDPGVPAILTSHVSVNDWLNPFDPGSESWMTVGSAPTLMKSAIPDGRFDYIALGHHHNNRDLGLQTPCWYSGSMQPVDFGEEGQTKGFMVFDIDPAKPQGARVGGSGAPRLEAVPARRFVTVQARPKADDPTAEVCAAIEAADVADAIVRVEVELGRPGATKPGDPTIAREQIRNFRIPEAKRLLESAHYVASFRPIVPRDPGLGSAVAGESLVSSANPLEALGHYFKRQQLDEARKARLLTAAKDLVDTVAPGA
ncbi:MAG: exonuclease SbcCD subunit D [Chloroflexi bacterium]|nr:exonuclease SbcCD subunit D [Chloroflexota bacterium]